MTWYGLMGAGRHGRETMVVLHEMLARSGCAVDKVRFVVEPGFDAPDEVNGVKLVDFESFVNLPGPKRFNIAIADGRVRERIAGECAAAGLVPFAIVAANSVQLGFSEIGEGAMLSPFSMVSTNVRIGKFLQLNVYSSIMHDCVIGDYVTVSPGVRCNGHVHIGDHAFIGSGALLRDGEADKPLRIGEGAVVGMGAVVIKDVAPYTTVVGNPARELVKKD